MQKGRLVLFDIDCTLINTGGAGTRALQLVIKNRYGVDDDLHDIEIAGAPISESSRAFLKSTSSSRQARISPRFSMSMSSVCATCCPKSKGAFSPASQKFCRACTPTRI